MASKERANPRSAKVSTIGKSPLDSLARYAVRYTIFLRFSARENETDGFASGGLKTADAPGMCELFHTCEKFFAKSTGTEARLESVAGPSEFGTPGSGQPACTDSPRGTAELRNWLQKPLATRGSPLDHFDIALARAVGQGLEAGVGAV